jgi:hypothetical protein
MAWPLPFRAAVKPHHLACFCYPVSAMARRKKPKLKIPKEARRRARAGIGLPPPERIIVEKRDKPPKHKKTLTELIEEN